MKSTKVFSLVSFSLHLFFFFFLSLTPHCGSICRTEHPSDNSHQTLAMSFYVRLYILRLYILDMLFWAVFEVIIPQTKA